MHYFKIIFFLANLFFLISCGKPPLLNIKSNSPDSVAIQTELQEQQEDSKIQMTFHWIITPSLEELGAYEITLNRPLLATEELVTYLWMPDMGHGSSPIEIKQLSSTKYAMSELAFIMPGLWVLHIEIIQNQQVTTQWQKTITL